MKANLSKENGWASGRHRQNLFVKSSEGRKEEGGAWDTARVGMACCPDVPYYLTVLSLRV